jgi:CRP/FNR family transcriptional regulator, cyclic AMP receptor protein
MTIQKQFKQGDILFRQGDASDHVMRISDGEIEILREVGDTSVLLGHVREGEWLGEMGVIENRGRNATARAATDTTVEVLPAEQFLDRVSRDPALSRDLLVRLSVRLRTIEDKIVGDLLPLAHEHLPVRSDEAVSPTAIIDGAPIALIAETDALRARIGATPIHIAHLPFVVGRVTPPGQAEPRRHPDLTIDDKEPFRLSRNHFMILRNRDRLLVCDLGSTLGTIVNGQAIGLHFMKDGVPLHHGENHIIAGGWGSPFEFVVSVGR